MKQPDRLWLMLQMPPRRLIEQGRLQIPTDEKLTRTKFQNVFQEISEALNEWNLPGLLIDNPSTLPRQALQMHIVLQPGRHVEYRRALRRCLETTPEGHRHISGLTVLLHQSIPGVPDFEELQARAKESTLDTVDSLWLRAALFSLFRRDDWHVTAPEILFSWTDMQWDQLMKRKAESIRITVLATVTAWQIETNARTRTWLEQERIDSSEKQLILSGLASIGEGRIRPLLGWSTYLRYRLQVLSHPLW